MSVATSYSKEQRKKALEKKHKHHGILTWLLIITCILATLIWSLFQDVMAGGYDNFKSNVELYTVSTVSDTHTTQSTLVASYLRSEKQKETYNIDWHKNSEFEVTGTGDQHLDELLTVFNMIAYHWDDIQEEVFALPDSGNGTPPIFPEDIDMEVFALSIIGTSLFESQSADTVEHWGNTTSVWATLTPEEKIEALLDNDWASKVNPDKPKNYVDDNGYAHYGNGAIAGSGESNGGYQRGNVVTGKNANGEIVTIGGRWGYGLYQWTYGRRVAFGKVWKESGIDMTTMPGQVYFIVVEATNSFGVGNQKQFNRALENMVRSKFKDGIWSDNIEYCVGCFWNSCVRGTYHIEYDGNSSYIFHGTPVSDPDARNQGILGGVVHGSKPLWNGHNLLEIIRAFSKGGITDVQALLGVTPEA